MSANLGNSGSEQSRQLEAWDAPQLIPLDLGSAQAKYCMFGNEGTPDNGPSTTTTLGTCPLS